MKKYTAAFLVSAVVFSLALQSIFAVFALKTSALDRFIYIRKIIEKSTRLSASAADHYMEFKKGPGTAILAVPSCDLNKALIPGSFDFFVMHTDNNVSVFSVYPSEVSARKHRSLYMKNVKDMQYNYSGGLFGFKCSVNGALYGRSFFITRDYSLLPPEIEVF